MKKCTTCLMASTELRTLVNGEETSELCDTCFMEAIVDITLNNERVAFSTSGRTVTVEKHI